MRFFCSIILEAKVDPYNELLGNWQVPLVHTKYSFAWLVQFRIQTCVLGKRKQVGTLYVYPQVGEDIAQHGCVECITNLQVLQPEEGSILNILGTVLLAG